MAVIGIVAADSPCSEITACRKSGWRLALPYWISHLFLVRAAVTLGGCIDSYSIQQLEHGIVTGQGLEFPQSALKDSLHTKP